MEHGTRLIYGLREQIVNHLRNDLYAGRLSFGERLSEVSLSKRFKVSRTPIRGALHQLIQEGLLESKPNHGVHVAAESNEDIQDLIIAIRRMIETFALQSCFINLTEEDFQHVDEIVDRMAVACENRDYSAITELDLEFHHAIIQRVGNPDLEMVWRIIVARVRSHVRDNHKRYSNPMDIHAEHAAIIKELRGGDLEAAIEILTATVG